MKRTIGVSAIFLIGLATMARGDGPPSAGPVPYPAPPPVGAVIVSSNLEQFSALVPAGLGQAIRHGLTVNIVPRGTIDWPSEYQKATEKYSSQAALDENDSIRNYVAGLPFPSIDPRDLKAGVKVAYDWRWGPFIPSEASVDSIQKTRAFRIDPARPERLIADDSQRDYRNENNCDRTTFVHYRMPGADSGDIRNSVNYKERGDECGPEGGAAIEVEYVDPARNDDVWFFIPTVRRWRQMQLRGGYPHQSCSYSCVQFAWEYAPPKTEAYAYRLLAKQPTVACVDAPSIGAGINDIRDPAHFGRLECEVRDAYVLEMSPRGFSPERLIPAKVYIDSETYVYLGAEIFRDSTPDSDVPIWSKGTNAAGETSMVLANDFYWPPTGLIFSSPSISLPTQ
jgi:hypothetical protein